RSRPLLKHLNGSARPSTQGRRPSSVSTPSGGGATLPRSGDKKLADARRSQNWMTPRRVFSLLALALCASALVGCAGGDALALDPVAKAASTTAKTQASRFDF